LNSHKIFISACLLGEKVRYDAKCINPITDIIQRWYSQNILVSFCPEVAGGLSVPRAAAEKQIDGRIITENGLDVTQAFQLGAEQALRSVQHHHIKMAILKSKSPSCGSLNIYDGTFSKKLIDGEGMCAQLLRENGVKIFDENQLKAAHAYWQMLV